MEIKNLFQFSCYELAGFDKLNYRKVKNVEKKEY